MLVSWMTTEAAYSFGWGWEIEGNCCLQNVSCVPRGGKSCMLSVGCSSKVAVVAPRVMCCVNMLWNCSFRGTWPVGPLLPTLMCICWSVVGSECPDRLAMDFGGAGAAQQGLTDSCQSGGGIGCTQNGERWDLTGLCPD